MVAELYGVHSAHDLRHYKLPSTGAAWDMGATSVRHWIGLRSVKLLHNPMSQVAPMSQVDPIDGTYEDKIIMINQLSLISIA